MLEDLVNHAVEGEQIGVIRIDIDHLKQPCEIFGHAAGDGAITTIARAVENASGDNCTIARFGGDEFLIVAAEFGVEKTRKLAEAIRMSGANVSIEANGYKFECPTLTIGVACFPDDGADAKEVLDAADVCCYVGKKRGGNRVISARDTLRREEPVIGNP